MKTQQEFKIDDLLKLVDYFAGEYELSNTEKIKYDLGKDKNVGLDDFIFLYEMILKGPFKNRNVEKLKFFMKYSRKLTVIGETKLDYLNNEIKKISKQYITEKEYPEVSGKSNARKKFIRLTKEYKKRGYSI